MMQQMFLGYGGSSGGGGGGGGGATDNTGSVYFDGNGDFLSLAASNDFNFGTSDFTIEGFFYKTTTTTLQTLLCSSGYYTSGNNGSWILRITSTSTIAFATYDGTGNEEYSEFSASTSTNTWHHFALVRSGTGSNQTKFYLDGVLAGSMTVSKSLTDAGTNGLRIGEESPNGPGNNFMNGYLSNIRIIKGTALYTSDFAVPGSPLTNVTNTKLLCCQSTTSVTAAAVAPGSITAHGNVALATIYPSAVGSVSFDGVDDHLNITGSSDLAFGTGDFTLECWVYFSSSDGTLDCIMETRSNTSLSDGFLLGRFHTTGYENKIVLYTDSGYRIASNSGVGNDTWVHVAVVRSSSTTKLYIDGVAQSTTYSDSNNYSNDDLIIGENANNVYQLHGFVSNFRMVKGTAVYTSNFTVPTASLTNITNTKLLCCQTAGPVTSAVVSPGTITVNGDPEPSTSSPFSSFNGLMTRFDLTGSSLNPSTDDFSSSLLESDGSFGGSGQSQYYEIDSRTTSDNRLAWEFDFSSVSSYDHFAIQFEYYWDAGDPNFKTTFAWQNNGTFAANLGSYFRTDRASSLYSGRWMGKDSTTASDTWGQTSSSWISVVGYHNINNNTGYLKFNGTKRIEGSTNADSTYTYYTSADTLSFAQFVDNAASDNGIRMRVGVIQISCWNGQESDMPAFNGRFT